jgi:hypothetical protein
MIVRNTSKTSKGYELMTLRYLRLSARICQFSSLGLAVFQISPAALGSQIPEPTMTPLVRVVDLNVGDSSQVELCDGTGRMVKLTALKEYRDAVRNAVRKAHVTIEVDGETVDLISATYQLPKTVAGTQIDCSITKGHLSNSNRDAWGLEKDARLRLWPADFPLVRPNTFVYPIEQRWFASATQMANEPTYVDGGENPARQEVYYHYGLDFGGAEGMADVLSATDGLVVSVGDSVLPGYTETPVSPRYDVVYLLDRRGWYYRYSHLFSIDAAIRPGGTVQMAQRLGVLGKEGGSGGWSHLHFDIKCRQPSGKWGIQEGYALIWQAYQLQYQPDILAVARPHHLLWAGEKIALDGSSSWSGDAKVVNYQWTFSNGSTAEGAKVERRYDRPGTYSEILKISNAAGQVDYDFAIINVVDRANPDRLPPTIHAAYAPTFGIGPGDPVTFKVRTFRTTYGEEVWDFGDGSPAVSVHSDGNANVHADDGYAIITHSYAKPGHYVARVQRSNEAGLTAIAHLHVYVEQ